MRSLWLKKKKIQVGKCEISFFLYNFLFFKLLYLPNLEWLMRCNSSADTHPPTNINMTNKHSDTPACLRYRLASWIRVTNWAAGVEKKSHISKCCIWNYRALSGIKSAHHHAHNFLIAAKPFNAPHRQSPRRTPDIHATDRKRRMGWVLQVIVEALEQTRKLWTRNTWLIHHASPWHGSVCVGVISLMQIRTLELHRLLPPPPRTPFHMELIHESRFAEASATLRRQPDLSALLLSKEESSPPLIMFVFEVHMPTMYVPEWTQNAELGEGVHNNPL